jgi:hypothetical protein
VYKGEWNGTPVALKGIKVTSSHIDIPCSFFTPATFFTSLHSKDFVMVT